MSATVALYVMSWTAILSAGCSGSNRNGRKHASTSDEEDEASAPLPEPTDFELLEVRLHALFLCCL